MKPFFTISRYISKFDDEISFGLGIASLVCWSVAEIPQIVTNFNNKSATGVSLAFLSTWIIGDVFNLIGCMLEPSTLPTQLYTALLYTIVTIILALQCVYYNHFLRLLNRNKTGENWGKEDIHPLLPKNEGERNPRWNGPIEVPNTRNFRFMSARSLAGSDTPPLHCYLKAQSGPPTLGHHQGSSSEGEEEEHEGKSTFIPLPSNQPTSQPRPIPRPVKYGTSVAAYANLAHLSRALRTEEQRFLGNAYGQWLGWLMAAIYMGGRLPQIWMNIKRGSVEGLNPFMFVFALIANATYVGSILVITSEWRMVKGNLPWLLDAIVCVLLDLFIILQYIFYKYIKINSSERRGEHFGAYVEADKPILI